MNLSWDPTERAKLARESVDFLFKAYLAEARENVEAEERARWRRIELLKARTTAECRKNEANNLRRKLERARLKARHRRLTLTMISEMDCTAEVERIRRARAVDLHHQLEALNQKHRRIKRPRQLQLQLRFVSEGGIQLPAPGEKPEWLQPIYEDRTPKAEGCRTPPSCQATFDVPNFIGDMGGEQSSYERDLTKQAAEAKMSHVQSALSKLTPQEREALGFDADLD